jgi:hypothetical protein
MRQGARRGDGAIAERIVLGEKCRVIPQRRVGGQLLKALEVKPLLFRLDGGLSLGFSRLLLRDDVLCVALHKVPRQRHGGDERHDNPRDDACRQRLQQPMQPRQPGP